VSEHQVRLEPSWKARVGDYLNRPEMQQLSTFLRAELRAGKTIYPPPRCIFATPAPIRRPSTDSSLSPASAASA
jgi:uracil DNA glycosylase